MTGAYGPTPTDFLLYGIKTRMFALGFPVVFTSIINLSVEKEGLKVMLLVELALSSLRAEVDFLASISYSC